MGKLEDFIILNEINNKVFIDKIKEVKEIKNKIDLLWKECDENKKDCDEVDYKTKILTNKVMNEYISMFLFTKELDKTLKRKDEEMYSVSKIFITKEYEERCKKYDKEILEILHKDSYTERKINSDLNFMYFMYGFVIKEEINKNEIWVSKDVIDKKKENN